MTSKTQSRQASGSLVEIIDFYDAHSAKETQPAEETFAAWGETVPIGSVLRELSGANSLEREGAYESRSPMRTSQL